jgi:hypothetical protein
VWNSLEAAKLLVAILTPLLLLALGVVINRAAHRVEEAQWANQKLIERRLEIHREMAPDLNDLFCFFAFVGNFRDMTPMEAISIKRKVDKTFHINSHLFSAEFRRRYRVFMKTCFKMFSGAGEDAKLRAFVAVQRTERGESHWDDEWEEFFVLPDPALPDPWTAYESLMTCFADELGMHVKEDLADSRERRSVSNVPRARADGTG